jgi:serine/threonine-protein kinase
MRFCPVCGQQTEDPACPREGQPTELFIPLDAAPDQGEEERDPLLASCRLVELLGQDHMGYFYRAERRATGATVTVRLLPPELSTDPGFTAAFERQVSAIRQVASPQVAKILQTGATATGRLFLVTESVEGRTLAQAIATGERFDWLRVRELALQVLAAFAEVHKRRVVHWDFRPEEIFLEQGAGGHETIKLLGFGLPPWFAGDDLPGEGPVSLRLPYYAAPERFGKVAVDGRGDLYSLGAVLFHLLTGRPPFMGASAEELVARIRAEHIPYLRAEDVPRGIPAEFLQLVRLMLSRAPEERPWEADEVVRSIALLPLGEDDSPEALQPLPTTRYTLVNEGSGLGVRFGDDSVQRRIQAKGRGRMWLIAILLMIFMILSLIALFFLRGTSLWPGAQKASTSPMSPASSSSIIKRSTPSAMPVEGGTPTSRAARNS